MRISVQILNTSLKGLRFETDRETIRVGRSGENDLVLLEQSVSRFHATVSARDGRLTVEDLGSRNQTRVGGEAISGPTRLEGGGLVSFGSVLAEISLLESESASAGDSEVTPPEAALAPGAETDKGIEARAGTGAADVVPKGWLAPREEGRVPAAVPGARVPGQRAWSALALILGLTAAGVLILFFLNSSGSLERPVGDPLGVSLRVGEEKLVQVPSGFVLHPFVEHPEVVGVSRPLNLELAVQLRGGSEGVTTVRLYNGSGEHICLHARVLPRKRQEVEDLFGGSSLTQQQRRRLARESMRLAEALRHRAELYQALRHYERASLLLESLAQDPPEEYLQARRWKDKLSKEVQARYEELTFDMGNFLKDGDRRMAMQRLAEIKELVPDEEDVRWQSADLLSSLLQELIEREKRTSRRRL